jgi:hypothetical protein
MLDRYHADRAEFEFETNERVQLEAVENKRLKKVARPERFELPTLWFEAWEAGNLKSFVCVA